MGRRTVEEEQWCVRAALRANGSSETVHGTVVDSVTTVTYSTLDIAWTTAVQTTVQLHVQLYSAVRCNRFKFKFALVVNTTSTTVLLSLHSTILQHNLLWIGSNVQYKHCV